MRQFIIFNQEGNILRCGFCQDSTFSMQAQKCEFVIEGQANDVTQKVVFDGLDESGQPINPQIVDKQKVAK